MRVFLLLAVLACALAQRPHGPDVSHYQGNINWASVAGSHVGFAICKATEGTTFVDASFKANWAGIESHGIRVRGAYHFGHPELSAVTQAAHFVSTVGALKAGDFLVLDIEANANKLPAATVVTWIRTFLEDVVTRSKLPVHRVWVYTGAWWWEPNTAGSAVAAAHPLWVSGYTTAPPMPRGWSHWTMWQYTDKASIPGVSGGCDASYFNTTQAALNALVGI